MQIRKVGRMIKKKTGILMMMGLFLGGAAVCHFAGEYLYMNFMKEQIRETGGKIKKETGTKIVIDAGHGGTDPGKIGVRGEKEKDLNLEIALKLQKYLEKQGIETVMTREDTERLGDSQAEDLKERVAAIDREAPALAVSIHQNSYTQESVRGPQVFYYTHSGKAEKAAELIQKELKIMDEEHARESKANATYYLLKNTKVPVVIVECGFLSNPVESSMLAEEAYQKTIAETIGNGIMKYVESLSE